MQGYYYYYIMFEHHKTNYNLAANITALHIILILAQKLGLS